jgi:small subunit ribosomal protein S13
MVQIFGKVLSNKKRVDAALKNISGLNKYQIEKVCNELNIGLDCKITDLSQSHIIKLLKLLERHNFLIEMSLKKTIQVNTKRLIEIKSHRGLKFVRKKGSLKR